MLGWIEFLGWIKKQKKVGGSPPAGGSKKEWNHPQYFSAENIFLRLGTSSSLVNWWSNSSLLGTTTIHSFCFHPSYRT
jgi:hypothetical protein